MIKDLKIQQTKLVDCAQKDTFGYKLESLVSALETDFIEGQSGGGVYLV